MLSYIMHIKEPLVAFLVALVLTACQPQASIPEAPELDQDELATLVMGTLQAIQSTEESAQATTQLSATPLPAILPQNLYFLSQRSGNPEVWRLEQDGRTLQQISNWEKDILDFDVNPANGDVITITSNRMRYWSTTGETLQTWKAGDYDLEVNLPLMATQFASPRISPDGRWLAYALNGLHLTDLDSGEDVLLIENEWEGKNANGELVTARLFTPESWSPDGKHLLVSIADPASASLAFFDLESRQLIPLQSSSIVCCQLTWASDSASLFVASPYVGLIDSGLWQYNIADGSETVLVPSSGEDATVNLVGWPYNDRNELRFFYTRTAGLPEGDTPLFMVETSISNAESPRSLRDDAFQIKEALWAADGELAIILPILQGQNGPLVLARADGSPLEVLIDDAWNLHWGP